MWTSPMYSTTKVTLDLCDIVQNGVDSIDVWRDCDTLLHPDYVDKFNVTDEELKATITGHFLYRQIGFETVGRFLHEWKQRTKEIAPHYRNVTYAQALLFSQDDPLESYHLTETFNETNEGSSSGTSEGTSSSTSNGTSSASGTVTEDNKEIFSDTPQGNISNLANHMTTGKLNDNTSEHSDTATQSNTGSGSSSSETSATAESSISRTLERRGNIGVQPLGDEVRKYQEAFEDMVRKLIKEYEPLFLRVY